MFQLIMVHLDMFDQGLLTEEKLSGWLRFHAWLRNKQVNKAIVTA